MLGVVDRLDDAGMIELIEQRELAPRGPLGGFALIGCGVEFERVQAKPAHDVEAAVGALEVLIGDAGGGVRLDVVEQRGRVGSRRSRVGSSVLARRSARPPSRPGRRRHREIRLRGRPGFVRFERGEVVDDPAEGGAFRRERSVAGVAISAEHLESALRVQFADQSSGRRGTRTRRRTARRGGAS